MEDFAEGTPYCGQAFEAVYNHNLYRFGLKISRRTRIYGAGKSSPPYVDTGNNSKSSLAVHAERLTERTHAICRFSGGVPTLQEGIKVFRDYCEEVGFWLEYPDGLFENPHDHGDEHEVWYAGEELVIKLAYPDFFGLRVIHRIDECQQCNPCEYFERWALHNEIFGDDVDLMGAFDLPDGIRIVLIQKAIKGTPATDDEIQSFFLENGWHPFRTEDGKAWFDEKRLLVVSDTHKGNLIKTANGTMVPIDFRIQPVSGAILDAVRGMI